MKVQPLSLNSNLHKLKSIKMRQTYVKTSQMSAYEQVGLDDKIKAPDKDRDLRIKLRDEELRRQKRRRESANGDRDRGDTGFNKSYMEQGLDDSQYDGTSLAAIKKGIKSGNLGKSRGGDDDREMDEFIDNDYNESEEEDDWAESRARKQTSNKLKGRAKEEGSDDEEEDEDEEEEDQMVRKRAKRAVIEDDSDDEQTTSIKK